jgi:hypothetical protein
MSTAAQFTSGQRVQRLSQDRPSGTIIYLDDHFSTNFAGPSYTVSWDHGLLPESCVPERDLRRLDQGTQPI